MKYAAGFLKVACAWMVILLSGSDAGHAPRKHGAAAAAAAASCMPKELTALTRSLVEQSLTAFDAANGKHLGTWSPGFPSLQVNENSPLVPSKVQCSLLFMGKGLGEVLKDQKNNLNPTEVSLHEELKQTIAQIDLLFKCLKHILGGECPSKPTQPEMPEEAFQRKQWSHTLLKMSRDYLKWLEHKVQARVLKVKGTNHGGHGVPAAKHQKYFEGSGYLL